MISPKGTLFSDFASLDNIVVIPARPFSAYNQGFYPSKVFIFKLKTDKHFFDIFFAKIESMQPILVRTNEKRPRIARA